MRVHCGLANLKQTSHQHVLAILQAALEAADPAAAIRRHLTLSPSGTLRAGDAFEAPIATFKRIFVVGAGKATAQMAVAVEELLGDRITQGYINVKYEHGSNRLKRIQVNECGHPVPDEAGWNGAQHIAAIAQEARKDDLVLCLISGGASALTPLPAGTMTLAEKQGITQKLLACGADIHEMNTVRKHFSALKGGQLARMAYPASVLTLILSDVIGDDIATIGSGPTAPDGSTAEDALDTASTRVDIAPLKHRSPAMRCSAECATSLSEATGSPSKRRAPRLRTSDTTPSFCLR